MIPYSFDSYKQCSENLSSEQYCKKKTRASGSSFAYAFGFLSKKQCRAMMALYAFCREIDDIADEIRDKNEATRQIAEWRDEIDRVFQDQASHPIGHELCWAKQHFAWDKELFYEMLDGMLTDISAHAFVKESDLSLYCYRVAGVVGLFTIEIFGYKHRQSRHFATVLGEALQLTNILRDVEEDMQRQRIYLPQVARSRFKVSDQDIYEGRKQHKKLPANLEALLTHYGYKAETAYQKALELLPLEDRISLRPAIMMAAIYYTYLKRMRSAQFNIWQHPCRISPLRKMIIVWKVWRYEKSYAKSHNAEKFPLRVDFS
ncbi:MAG: squalene/phytoene synthase family protein [Mariprofundaceae bacterium]|nr:squalene/phytoene synthase family protein [Mariprofundaceae bacterium]